MKKTVRLFMLFVLLALVLVPVAPLLRKLLDLPA